MRNSLAVLLFVVCFCIRCVKLTHPRGKSVQSSNSFCIPDKQNHAEVHSRKRRYLIFGNGASISMTASAVKTLVARAPQGLNLLCEETVYYELPSSLTIPTIEKPNTTKSPTIRKTIIPRYTPYLRHKRKVDTEEKIDGSYTDSQGIEALFFQQLERLAKTYGFNGQHCIMRTICEARHFLYPRGQSLFHDFIRIILEFSLPTTRMNKKYLTASNRIDPMDCANLYGPHCRISFLDYFTEQIHGKFM